MLARRPVASGRQVTFLPVETLLCLACSFRLTTVTSAGPPHIRHPSRCLLSRGCSRGRRPACWRKWPTWTAPVRTGLAMTCAPEQCSAMTRHGSAAQYRVLLHAARAEGIGPDQFPGLPWPGERWRTRPARPGGTRHLHTGSRTTRTDPPSLRRRWTAGAGDGTDLPGSRPRRPARLRAERAAQLWEPVRLLRPEPSRVLCRRMLLARHIKPWKDSSPSERLDFRNGLAACPAHDVAFDTGLITVNGGLRIHLAPVLADATEHDPGPGVRRDARDCARCCCFRLAPWLPSQKYLDWHRQNVFGTDQPCVLTWA